MSEIVLKSKPLVEVILEIKWALKVLTPNTSIDPHYKLLMGRLYDRLAPDYPAHEQLPSSMLPEEIAGYIPQHRFRVAADQWPLIQLGPGLLTLNETDKYVWSEFQNRAIEVVRRLYDAHPKTDEFRINSLQLRYVDAVNFDYYNNDIFAFLHEKLKINVNLPEALFNGTHIQQQPNNLNWISSFRCDNPIGQISIRFATGSNGNGSPIIIWETVIQSTDDDVPVMQDDFAEWLEAAHRKTDYIFFTLIKGDLEDEFNG